MRRYDARSAASNGPHPRTSRADLVCSARLNPDLADRYAEVARRIGHRFRTDITMADVIAEAHDVGQLALIPVADIA